MKKVICFALAFSLLLSAPVFAEGNEMINEEPYILFEDNSHNQTITNAVSSILYEKEFYGFSDENILDLWVGTPILAYEAINGAFVQMGSISYYPILDSSNNLVCVAALLSDEASSGAHILPDFAALLNQHIDFSDNTSFSLIYDDTSIYSYCEGNLRLIKVNSAWDVVSYRDSLSEIPNAAYENISTRQIIRESYLDLANNIATCGQGDDWVYVSGVELINQPNNYNWCWAACMAALVDFELGQTYTCIEMGRLFTTDTSAGRSTTLVQSNLREKFRLVYSLRADTSTTAMFQSLSNGHPVYGDFQRTGGAHAMIIRGIDFSTNTFSVMDPAYYPNSNALSIYRTGTVTTNGNFGTFTIVKADNSAVYTLYQYLYM